MNSKNPKDPQMLDMIQQARNFEVSVNDGLRKSERRAWMIAMASSALAFVLGVGYLLVMPLKKEIPYLVVADSATGATSLTRLDDDKTLSTNESINKSNVAHFVTARESYDWDLINRRDWNTVFAMAAPAVAAEYEYLFADSNPSSPDKVWGQKSSVRVKIKSIVLLNADKGLPNGATVRFDRLLLNKQSGQITPLESKIATLAFEYKSQLKMVDELRVENPLGFQVTAYRADTDAEGFAQMLKNTGTGSSIGSNFPAPAAEDIQKTVNSAPTPIQKVDKPANATPKTGEVQP